MKIHNYILLLLTLIPLMQQALEKPSVSWAEQTLQKMSLKEKIGQLFVIAAASCFDQPEELLASAMTKSAQDMSVENIEKMIREYHVGGLIFLFKSTPDKQVDFMNHYHSLSKYPMWTFQDSEWGISMRLYETVRFPRNMTLGAIQNNELLYEFGKEVGRQCKVIGVDMNLSPVVDVNNNPSNPVISDRSLGENPEIVAEKAIYIMRGLHDGGTLACAKHFPGHGDTNVDSHLALPVIEHDKKRLHDVELLPIRKMIAAGANAIMTAHLQVPVYDSREHTASSLSKTIVTDLLKNELGFEGLIITDGLGMKAVSKYYEPGNLELEAYLAGNDILLSSPRVPEAVKKIEEAVLDGRISLEDLNKRVLKILKAKEQLNVPNHKPIDKNQLAAQLHTPHAYALKKRLYQEAITLVQNKQNVVPAKGLKNAAVLQIGGTSESVFTKVVSGMQSCSSLRLSAQESREVCDQAAKQIESADSVIVGIFDMNKFESKQFGLSNNTLDLLRILKAQGKQVIVTLFGNPYSLKYFKQEDAVIMAYEDDEDAQEAAAQVIFGQIEAKGKLPVTA